MRRRVEGEGWRSVRGGEELEDRRMRMKRSVGGDEEN